MQLFWTELLNKIEHSAVGQENTQVSSYGNEE